MGFREQTLNKKYVYRGKILNLRADEVSVKNGASVREIVEHNGGSAIYCEKDGKVLLVKQFRYAYGQDLWEIPAGKREKGEDAAITAARELEEECGVRAGKMTFMFSFYPSPGYTNEIINVYRAQDLTEGTRHQDDDEDVSVHWIDKQKINQMIESGEIKDGKTLLALKWSP